MTYRRKCVENYDEVYAGLDKTFYTREMFLQFSEEHGADVRSYNPITNCTGIISLCLIAICIKNNA